MSHPDPLPFERSQERADLRHILDRSKSVLMLAPRRIGKTWLMSRLAHDLCGNWAVIQCNVEGIPGTEEAFFEHICARIEGATDLKGQATARLHQFWSNLKTRDLKEGWQQALRTDWKAFVDTLVARLEAQPDPTVIMVDEIALFVMELNKRSPERVGEFLYHLRALRQRHTKVRWLFTGSVGLDIVARKANVAGALVDLQIFPVEPFDRGTASAFLDHLTRSGDLLRPFVLPSDARDRLLDELGWFAPYYLAEIANLVRPTGAQREGAAYRDATPADIDRAFAALLRDENRSRFAPWEEHVRKYFAPEDIAALRRILDACMRNPQGELLDTLLARFSEAAPPMSRRQLLDHLSVLINAGFLTRIEEAERLRFRFRSGLLRRYWELYQAE